jgi:hypothetical protein
MVRKADLRNKTSKGRIASVAEAPIEEAPVEEAVAEEAIDLSSLTKAELVALANERGVSSKGTKAKLVERLSEVESDGESE